MTQDLAAAQRAYVVRSLQRYWPQGEQHILALPIPFARADEALVTCPPQLSEVELPEWAWDVGVQGKLLVSQGCLASGAPSLWRQVDWLTALFWYMNGLAERACERRSGPIHSYAFRLKGWDPRLWNHAWVNRIALFLRRWAASFHRDDEERLLGPLPRAAIMVTHDLDAVSKTLAIRCKQSVFHGFNAARALLTGRWRQAGHKAIHALRFFASSGCYDQQLSELVNLERANGVSSQLNVYGGTGGWRRTPKQLLFDPAYSVDRQPIRRHLKQFIERGGHIGLHPSFNAWRSEKAILTERERVERATGVPVRSGRQHWLRFSWEKTWKAQQGAGLTLDTTLGFNDRPGFRNGAALRFHPWDLTGARPMTIEAMPLVLMDSHLYDYAEFSAEEREREIQRWIGEIFAVRGEATVLWHPHTLSKDYGWKEGFEALLRVICAHG